MTFGVQQIDQGIAENSVRLHGAVLVNAIVEEIERLVRVGYRGLPGGGFNAQ
jgi:hypothetical protein